MSQTNNDQAKQSTPLKDQVPDPEVMPRAKRRRFSAAHKRRILDEGGMIWESEDQYDSLDAALQDAEAAIAGWFNQQGIEDAL